MKSAVALQRTKNHSAHAMHTLPNAHASRSLFIGLTTLPGRRAFLSGLGGRSKRAGLLALLAGWLLVQGGLSLSAASIPTRQHAAAPVCPAAAAAAWG